jgi:hypothetical protein
LSLGFPQQACSALHILRSQKALALLLAFILSAGGFFFAGSREARAAGHDGGQQSPQAAQQEPAPASPQSVPAGAPTIVQPASVEPPPVASQVPVSQAPVVTQSAPSPPVSSAPVAADPAPARNPTNIESPATTVQTPPSTPLSTPVGSAPTVSSTPPPVLTAQDSSKPAAQNPGPPATAGVPVLAPQPESAPKESAGGSPEHYTPPASANQTPQPVSKTTGQPGPGPQTPPRPVSADNPNPVASPSANPPAQPPRLVGTTSNQAVRPILGTSGKAGKEMSFLLTGLGRDAVTEMIKPLRDVAPSFLLSDVDTKKGTAAWVSAAPDTSGSLIPPSVLLGNVEDSAVGLLQGVANVGDSAVRLLQDVASSVLESPTNMATLPWVADSYKGTVGTPSADVPFFSRGAQTTAALPGSSPVAVESASHDPPEPSSPLSLPEESNLPFSLSSSSHLSSGGGGSVPLLLLLAGALASGLFLLERNGRLSWASLQLLKPSSPLIPVLERPG